MRTEPTKSELIIRAARAGETPPVRVYATQDRPEDCPACAPSRQQGYARCAGCGQLFTVPPALAVWILFHETNSGHAEESDGYVEAVYATEEAAEAAKLAALRAAIAEGYAVYWNPDTQEENVEWSHDWHVEAHTVSLDGRLPTDGFFDFLTKEETTP